MFTRDQAQRAARWLVYSPYGVVELERLVRLGAIPMSLFPEEIFEGESIPDVPVVLVVVNRDGLVETYTRGAQVRVVHKFQGETAQEEIAIDNHVYKSLPPQWKEIFYENQRGPEGHIKDCLTLDEEARRLNTLELFKRLDNIGEKKTQTTVT